jgi:uncharacterized protein (TIGR02145 family)
MNKRTLKYSIILILTFFIFSTSCKKEDEKKDDNTQNIQVPVVTTGEITYITDSSAVCAGKVTSDGGGSISARGVCWSTSQTPTISDNKSVNGSCIGNYACSMKGLNYITTYFARAFATNSAGTGYGNIISFTTLDSEIPYVKTLPVNNITQSSASSGGNITYQGFCSVVTSGICWSTNANPTINDSKTTDGTNSDSYLSSLTGLATGVKYYVRAYATNCKGTGYGSVLSFTTASGVPILSTSNPFYITNNTAASGGTIISNCGSFITSKGICWSLNSNPTVSDNVLIINNTNNFSDTITGLEANTTYYVRSFATNGLGNGYGEIFSFKTLPSESETVTDVDGNIYHTVTIGTQVWLIENLKTTRYSNGDLIGTTTPFNLNISGESNPKYQWAYNGDESTVSANGRYYTWYSINDSRGVCPIGWHIPSQTEWQTLGNYLTNNGYGTTYPNYVAPAIAATYGWNSYYLGSVGYNPSTNNSSGLTIIPVGYRHYSFNYFTDLIWAYLWISNEINSTQAYSFKITEYSTVLDYDGLNKSNGLPVRCVRD